MIWSSKTPDGSSKGFNFLRLIDHNQSLGTFLLEAPDEDAD